MSAHVYGCLIRIAREARRKTIQKSVYEIKIMKIKNFNPVQRTLDDKNEIMVFMCLLKRLGTSRNRNTLGRYNRKSGQVINIQL